MGPTPPAPLTADDGGGGAGLEEGGRDLGRQRDADEGVCRVRWVWAGGTMMMVGSLWKREGAEGRKEKEGRSASCCLSPGG